MAATVDEDLWWGYLLPEMANIGILKQAQKELIDLGVNYADAGRILSKVQRHYVNSAHAAAQRFEKEQLNG